MSFHSGRTVEVSSSNMSWPRSTHCITAILAKNVVHEAIKYIASVSFFLIDPSSPKDYLGKRREESLETKPG